MTVAGLVRLRKHQFGRQDTFGTKVAATRAYAFKGVPSVDLNWTDPDVDVGSIVTTVAPQRGIPALTAALTDPQLSYNNLPLVLDAVLGGNVNPSGGTIETWAWDPSAVDPLDDQSTFTYEFFDDTGADDAYQLGDGILDSVTFTGPEGLGPITTSMSWRFGSAASNSSTDSQPSPAVPTASLDVESDPALVYLKDMSIYLASTAAGLAAGQVSDALHSFELVIAQTNDDKRFANGTQTFDVSDRSRTGYTVTLTASWAKTSDIIGTGSETDAWFSDTAVDRYCRLDFISTKIIAGATPFSWLSDMPMRYYTRTEGDSGGNAIVVLEGHAFYDSGTFDGFFKSTVKNNLHAVDLGSAGS
jgi:hypothetical protein